jgi:hypothetical protein
VYIARIISFLIYRDLGCLSLPNKSMTKVFCLQFTEVNGVNAGAIRQGRGDPSRLIKTPSFRWTGRPYTKFIILHSTFIVPIFQPSPKSSATCIIPAMKQTLKQAAATQAAATCAT